MNVQELMAKAMQAASSAKILLETGDTDGASNRAYYAMFDAARAALLASGFDVGKTHKGVLNAFSDRLIKNGPVPKEMGRLLKHAETFRYVADYAGDPVELSCFTPTPAHCAAQSKTTPPPPSPSGWGRR